MAFHHCMLCLSQVRRSISLCLDCEEKLPWQPPGCLRCGLRTGDLGPGRSVCGQCEREPPLFDRCHALFEYRAPVNRMIARFKYQHSFIDARVLSRLLVECFHRHYREEVGSFPQALLPVPLHRWRLCHRGYNQSLELARIVARHSALPLYRRHCLRHRHTGSQQGLGRRARQHNMANAFGLRRARHLTGLRHIAIIDDVVTTGATANALAALLRAHDGPERIDIWCLARVEPPE